MFSLQTIFGSGKQFYALLNDAALAAHDSTRTLHKVLSNPAPELNLDAIKLARQREREISDRIGRALVDSFITPFEREDIEALRSALYKIPKQTERFADRYALAPRRIEGIDFAPRAAMLEQGASIVKEMVAELQQLRLEPMTVLDERLRALESEADRLLLETYRDLYSGRHDAGTTFLLRDLFEMLEKAIDRCREAGGVAFHIALKNA
ncbi:MAG: DUF47 domain-containing protein [Panacagrimonas sp.]